jgi:hypothetical protein
VVAKPRPCQSVVETTRVISLAPDRARVSGCDLVDAAADGPTVADGGFEKQLGRRAVVVSRSHATPSPRAWRSRGTCFALLATRGQ